MADTTDMPQAPQKRRSWVKILGIAAVVLVVLVIGLYFVATSAGFLKGVILPRVSKSLNAKITVGDASISPFRRVVLDNLRVETTGTEPLLTAARVELQYSLMAMMKGNINVDLVSVTSPSITLIKNPDGSSNLDPILKAGGEKPAEAKPAEPAAAKPLQIDLKKLAVTDGKVSQIQIYDAEHRDVVEVSNLNVVLENIRNGQSGKLVIGAGLKMERHPPGAGAAGTLQAKLDGKMDLGLTADLKPAGVKGDVGLQVVGATGAFAEAAGVATTLNVDMTASEIKEVALRIQKGSARLGELAVAGPLDLGKMEGRLQVRLSEVGRSALNLGGAPFGLDFGPTTISSTNQVQLSNGGKVVGVAGRFDLNHFQVTRTNQTTPAMDLGAEYNLEANLAASNVIAKTFTVTATQKGQAIIQGGLSSPMSFSWGGTGTGVGDSTFTLTVNHLDLADWKAFAADMVPTGDVNAKVQVVSKQEGTQMGFDVDSRIQNLSVRMGTNAVSGIVVGFQTRGQATNFTAFNIAELKMDVAQDQRALVNGSGSGTFNSKSQAADFQLKAKAMLADLARLMPAEGMKISSGTAETTVHLLKTAQGQGVTGSFALADFGGQFGTSAIQALGTTADFDVQMTPDQKVEIRKLTGVLTEGGAAGGSFKVDGNHNLANQSGQMNLALTGLNQAILKPLLEPALGDKKLVSVAIDATAAAQYALEGNSGVRGQLVVTNLVVNDPRNPALAASPLDARLQFDVSMKGKAVDVRQVQLALTPTDRAKNVLDFGGKVDATNTNAISGDLKLTAESLDVTRYYDLFTGGKQAATSTPTTGAPPSSGPSGPEKEPEAMNLPLRNFSAQAAIGRFYLHEVEMTNMQMVVKIDGGKIVVKPASLVLNGAPVSSTVDLDLGVPGFKYDVGFNASQVPLAPLVNSFQPDRRGQVGGTFTAKADIKGAGVTGPNLKKNLAGQFDFGSTNLNLSVVNVRSPVLRTLINVVTVIPDLIKNPEGAAGSLLKSLTGQQSSGGLADELSRSPIDVITARGNAGSGQVQLQEAVVQSPAFRAEAAGTVALNDVLTNSALQIPVQVALSRRIAQQLNLVTATTPTNAVFVGLPQFVTLKGTVGEPKTDINKLALVGLAAKSIGGIGGSIGGQAGGILQGIGGILGGGGKSTATNAPGQSPTNQPRTGGLLQGLGGLLGGGTPATNAPSASTNAPASTNQPPVQNLLNGLFGPRKK